MEKEEPHVPSTRDQKRIKGLTITPAINGFLITRQMRTAYGLIEETFVTHSVVQTVAFVTEFLTDHHKATH